MTMRVTMLLCLCWTGGVCLSASPADCAETDFAVAKLDPFGDAGAGVGSIRYARRASGAWELQVDLERLRAGEQYFLSLNASEPGSPTSEILGRVDVGGWPRGAFYRRPIEGQEGYWDFAAIPADGEGKYVGRFVLPLPPGQYAVKFLVKERFGRGEPVLQATGLRFVVESPSAGWRLAVLGLGAVAIALLSAIAYAWWKWKRRRRAAPREPLVLAQEPVAQHKLVITRWRDLGIGIGEGGEYLAIAPCPGTGDVFLAESAVQLPLSGRRWQKFLHLLALSEHGNSARKEDLFYELGFFSRGDAPGREKIAELADDKTYVRRVNKAKQTLTRTVADLNRELREFVRVEAAGAEIPLSGQDRSDVRSAFVVRYLLRDPKGKLRFGESEP
jgi:hypothetical protein